MSLDTFIGIAYIINGWGHMTIPYGGGTGDEICRGNLLGTTFKGGLQVNLKENEKNFAWEDYSSIVKLFRGTRLCRI